MPCLRGLGGLGARRVGRPNPRAYDEYFKAYSVAMLPGKPRDNVSYGGKIIMPPSALANLTQMDLESPWMFKLRNPANPAASTHSGVLEFIAEEGCVHLPQWMMKTLRLSEGDPIRITGAELPKGKMVKLQAQTVDFLEISDPKAVLEQALRNFSALTQGDIIEISYNSIVFGLLVMETHPGGEGISVLDTDLEVDFAAPVGYVEPERPKAAPRSTMASKLNIDLSSSIPGSSRPSSSLGGAFAGASPEAQQSVKEATTGKASRAKARHYRAARPKARVPAIENPKKHRKAVRSSALITNGSLDDDVSAPAPLNLPFGKLFFGFSVQPYVPPNTEPTHSPPKSSAFSGSGATLTGRSQPSQPSAKGKEREQSSGASWSSGGQTLGSRAPPAASSQPRATGAGGASVPVLPQRRGQVERSRSPTPDFGVDDEDDVMYYSD
ncbi:ubiquitin fusion degradation protein UFD1-domain-containing protein [Trametes elegans]|nr:ubiquitin fusion degradation protein UFD1-domain-containing protein [Trametes elegans]